MRIYSNCIKNYNYNIPSKSHDKTSITQIIDDGDLTSKAARSQTTPLQCYRLEWPPKWWQLRHRRTCEGCEIHIHVHIHIHTSVALDWTLCANVEVCLSRFHGVVLCLVSVLSLSVHFLLAWFLIFLFPSLLFLFPIEVSLVAIAGSGGSFCV